MRAPDRSAVPSLTGSESIAVTLVVTAAFIVVGAYLGDQAGIAFTPSLMLVATGGVAAALLIGIGRAAIWDPLETTTFAAIVAITFGWLVWIARPSFFPLGGGPDLTHHLLLINYIESHWRLVHDPAVQEYLGEMVQYTPGSHILTALAGAWSRSNGLHAAHSVMAASAALKSGFVFLIALRMLPRSTPRVPIAALASMSLFASQIYFLGSFAQYSFLAQVVSEYFAIGVLWTLTLWDQESRRWPMAVTGVLGAALFLTWPILIGPPLLVLGALVVLPNSQPLARKVIDAAIAVVPIVIVAVIFSLGRLHYLEIAGTGGEVVTPMVREYGWLFLVLSSAGIAVSAADLIAAPKGRSSSRTLALFTAAILLQAGGLYLFARLRSNDPYMARKMFYMLLYPQAIGVALTVGMLWHGSAFGAKAIRRTSEQVPAIAWGLALIAAIFIVRPLVGAPKSLIVAKHPATSVELESAGQWVREHIDPHCVEYLVGDDNTAYWLHLAVLGNPRRGARTGDNATYELNPALVRWLTPGGLPYAIADLRVLPTDIKDGSEIVAQFGTAAVLKRAGPSSCQQG